MKKLFLIISACLGLYGLGHAQISDVNLGYCNHTDPTSGVRCTEKNAWVSGAIYIPASTLDTYAGNQINGISTALKSKLNVEELKVWLRRDINGDNIIEQSINAETEQKVAKGWNTLNFDNSWNIPADNETGLYIGYSYLQKSTCQAMGIIDTPTPNGLFIKFGENEWEDHSSEGTLCVEALISGENLPKVNLAFTDLTLQDVYIIERGTMEISGTVRNIATYTVTGFDVNAYVNDIKVSSAHVDCDLTYGNSGNFTVELPLGITSIGDGNGSVTVTIDNINEGADEDMSDNSLTGEFLIVQHDFKHRIFVEEFTTEKCPNCPRVANYIHDALNKEEFRDNVFVVCHHAGYYTDWLTSSFDANYLWLFNDNTYAPAMAVDRNPRNEKTSVWCPGSSSDMEGEWRKALNKPAFVSLNINAEIDPEDENHITVNVNGAKSLETLCDNPTITVYIVEDNIKAHSQAGGGSDYIHNHVNRAVNSAWGDPVEFNGNDYEYTCEFNLSHLWNRDNIQIVAFIANYNSQDPTDCVVKNAANLLLSQSGVRNVEMSDNAETEIYSISGILMTDRNLAPGLYIRKSGNKVEKCIVK